MEAIGDAGLKAVTDLKMKVRTPLCELFGCFHFIEWLAQPHLEVLKLGPDATLVQIKKAYRKLALAVSSIAIFMFA